MLETTVSAAQLGRRWIVSARGELDLHAAPALQDELERADGATAVIVDLTAVTFVDSTVLGVLLTARSRLSKRGSTLVLVSDDPRIVRMLEITGLDRLFRIERTLRDAVRALALPTAAA